MESLQFLRDTNIVCRACTGEVKQDKACDTQLSVACYCNTVAISQSIHMSFHSLTGC